LASEERRVEVDERIAAAQWLLSIDDIESGPYEPNDVLRMVQIGLLPVTTLVRQLACEKWQSLNSALPLLYTASRPNVAPQERPRANLTDGAAPPSLHAGERLAAQSIAEARDFSARSRRRTPNRDLWTWYAWMTGLGIPLSLLLVGLPMLVIGIILSFVLIYRGWASIQKLTARITPGAAIGFYFIPLFNIYWGYPAVVGLAEDLNDSMDQLREPGPRVSRSLAIWSFVLYLSMFVPYLNLLTVLPTLVVYACVLKQISEATDAINTCGGSYNGDHRSYRRLR
jgi:hypothetical protein